MVIGDNFVFVHNPKTGGSSVRNALLPFGVTDKQHAGIFPPRGYNSKTFRIVTVRNPWDRMVSGYEYSQRNKDEKEPFEEWLRGGDPWSIGPFDFKRTPQCYWAWACNYVLRFEHLSSDFANVCNDMNIDAELPHVNKSQRREDYREYYTSDKLIEVVEDRFKPDIIRFDYKFGE